MNKWLVAILALPLIMAIAFGGVYAHWDDAVRINGSVSTGVFNIEMSLEDFGDYEYDYDVGTIDAYVSNWDDGDDSYDNGTNDALTIIVDNVYPGYEFYVMFNIDNTGTIPALISGSLNCSCDMWDEISDYVYIDLYLWVDGIWTLIASWDPIGGFYYDDTYITVDEGNCTFEFTEALGPGETWYFELDVYLTDDPNPPETLMDQTCSFTVDINGIQAVPIGPP